MKKLFLILFPVLFLFSCGSVANPIPEENSSLRTFKINGIASPDLVEMKLITNSTYVIIYADTRYEDLDLIPAANWQSITSEFNRYYGTITNVYGTHTDVDKNGKVILVFHLMPEDNLGGYFTSADLFKELDRNNAEVVNINLVYVVTGFKVEETMDTVFHEFQHLINFNMSVLDKGVLTSFWLNEALSESAYFVYKKGLPNETRFSVYNDQKASYSDNISKGKYFFSFNGIESYVTASMFMYWLYLHGGGDAMLKKIAQGVTNYDYTAVVNAVRNTSAFKKSALGSQAKWSDILGAWLEANYVNDISSSSIKGYKNKYKFAPKQFKGASSVSLLPGGAIYTSDAYVVAESGNIAVKSITSNGVRWQAVYNKFENCEITDESSVNVPYLPLKSSSSSYSITTNSDESLSRKYWIDRVQ